MAFATYRHGYDTAISAKTKARWADLIIPPSAGGRLSELGSGAVAGAANAPQARLLAEFIVSLASQPGGWRGADARHIEQAALSLFAACLSDRDGKQARLSEPAQAALDRAKATAFIDRELFSARLTVDRISSMTDISRSTLYRLFDSDGGVATYIRERRLDGLLRDLLDAGNRAKPIAPIAEARGFHCLSTLNRAFRRRFGCTPQEVRNASNQPMVMASVPSIEPVISYLRRQ
jgi:AraC-like DNA-binding protein